MAFNFFRSNVSHIVKKSERERERVSEGERERERVREKGLNSTANITENDDD